MSDEIEITLPASALFPRRLSVSRRLSSESIGVRVLPVRGKRRHYSLAYNIEKAEAASIMLGRPGQHDTLIVGAHFPIEREHTAKLVSLFGIRTWEQEQPKQATWHAPTDDVRDA